MSAAAAPVRLSALLRRDVAADPVITAVTADSRQVQPGALFVALPGTAADGRAYRVEFLDGDLAVNPQVWSGFLANGAWTNTEPYTNRHVFFDNGAATNSGVPVQTQRYYRIEVWLP